MLSKVVSSTIFKVFGMTRPGIEPRSPGPLANTLTAGPMSRFFNGPQTCRISKALLRIAIFFLALNRFIKPNYNKTSLWLKLKFSIDSRNKSKGLWEMIRFTNLLNLSSSSINGNPLKLLKKSYWTGPLKTLLD